MTEGEQPAARPKLRYKNRNGYKPPKRGPKPKPPKRKPKGRPQGSADLSKDSSLRRAAGQAFRQAKCINPNLTEARAFRGNALALFQSIYKDPDQPFDARVEAAKAAIAFESPRLQTVDLNASVGVLTHEEALKRLKGEK